MNNSKIIFAFAVNSANKFEKKHFGDVDKYLIYEYCNGEFSLISHQINNYKSVDEKHIHGSKEKGNSIIKLLKKNKVKVLVSPQFGINIKMINQHFIPVAIHKHDTENVFELLLANMKWIIDELEINPTEYRLFSINTGILKSTINK
nr:NifB/NifX family molybdenum-iron cluster-binding protein [uncultured Marinifilum sp.]